MTSRNTGRTRQGLNRLREGKAGGMGMSYNSSGSISKAVTGDEDAPFLKEPPFTTGITQLASNSEINLAGDGYQFTSDVSVLDWRILTLYIEYDVVTADDILSIIPEFSMEDDGNNFWPIGVVDAAITSVALLDVNVPFEPPFGSRTFYPTELRTLALAVGDNLRQSLAFDVSPYRRFRFAYASIGTGEDVGGNLVLSYNLNV